MAKRGRKKKSVGLDISGMSKGMLRKLTALRKSLGNEIADTAFAKWLTTQPAKEARSGDQNAARIAELLTPAAVKGEFRIPRGGYIIRRGKGKVIVEAAPEQK